MTESSIWTEKYRPQTFDEVKGQKEIVQKIRAFVETKSMPHLLFSGPAGVGKCVTGDTPIITDTGAIKSIKDCFNEKLTKVMTLNAMGEISPASIAYFHREYAGKLLCVRTSAGKRVTTTPEHPFLVLKEGVPTWVKAEELRPNNLVASPLVIRPHLSRWELCWEKHPCFWAVLKKSVSLPPHPLYVRVKSKVLEYLQPVEGATAAEISVKIGEKHKVVNWAIASLIKEKILSSSLKKPRQYSLTKKQVDSTIIPYALVTDFSLVEKLLWKGKFHSPSTTIFHFRTPVPDFYEWLGLVFGDGHVRTSSIRFYNCNNFLRSRFVELSKLLFGSELRFQEKERKGVPYIEIMKCRVLVALLEHFYSIPLHKPKADMITVPSELFTAPDEYVAAFIRGYFECDGSCYKNIIELSSTSKTMIEGLPYLLLRWGIHPHIKNRKRQYYLTINSIAEILRFQEKVNPRVKTIVCQRASNTNVDVMTISKEHLGETIKLLGIEQKELNEAVFVEHIFEREKGSRIRVQKLYQVICDLARSRIKTGLETITLCERFPPTVENEVGAVFSQLCAPSSRTHIGALSGIRYDRLKEYYEGKREPTLANLIRILKVMKNLQVHGAGELSSHLREQLVARQNIVRAIQLFSISYAEIGRRMDESAASINYYFNNDGLSLQAVCKLNSVFIVVKQILEERIFSQELLSSLELLEYLAKAEIYWDTIKSVENVKGDYVYDLNVVGTHNFIGGHGGGLTLHNTTLSLVIAKQLFGENWRQNVLELNASDERGIDIVRVKVKDFARTKALGDAPFKLIYLDESDALTKEAQQALRRTMENYTKTCRFILSCNYSSKIIDPIQSRCAVFRFKPLAEEEIYKVIKGIANEEKLQIGAEAQKALFEVCDGDCRRLENILQSCAILQKEITPELVYSMASVAKPKEVKEVLALAVKGSFLDSRKKLLDLMLDYGLSGLDIIKQIQKEIWNLELEDRKKVELVDKCGEVEFRMVEGSDEYLQLESFLAFVMMVGKR